MQALGMSSSRMRKSSALLSSPSSVSNAAAKPDSTKRAKSRPRGVLVEVPSTPGWERELSESRQAQLQHSQSSVAVAQRPSSFDDNAFEAREAPLSGAAAVWEDIVEVSLPCWLRMWSMLM